MVFTGALASCEQFGLAHEVLTSAELTARYPGYQLPRDHLALFQPRGGFLLPERCISGPRCGALAPARTSGPASEYSVGNRWATVYV